MRMLSVLAVIAAPAMIAMAAPATAEPTGPAETGSFEHEGYTYVYSVEQKGDAQLISGRRYPGGTAFSLRVRNGKVTGTSGGNAVSFSLSEVEGAADGAKPSELSMR